jgi:hypothetical protein
MDAVLGVCPHCGRPNDDNEIELAGTKVFREAQAAKARVRKMVAWGVLAVLAFGVFAGRRAINTVIGVYKKQFDAALDRASNGGDGAPAPTVGLLASTGTVQGVLAPEIKVSTVIAYAAPVDPPIGEDQWGISGRAFDLKTLKPISGARLFFTSGTGAGAGGFSAFTDKLGEFRVVLAKGPEEGYTVHYSTPDYAPLGLCEHDIPYADLSASDRAQLIGIALEGDGPPSHIHEPDSGAPLRIHQDVFFAPRERQ